MAVEENGNGDKIIQAALRAYGIDRKYVHGSRYDQGTGEAIVVTVGGSKVRFKDGDKPEKLDDIAVTGVNPKAAKRKPITGAEKK